VSLVKFHARNHRQQVDRRGPDARVDDRATTPEVFDPLHARFNFSIDVAATPHNAKLSRYFGPADLSPAAYRCMWNHPDECGAGGCADCEHRRTAPLALDGLAQSWKGERVWCNPPYSQIAPWVEKAWAETDALVIVMLLPANRTEQGWWQEHVEPYRDRSASVLRCEFLKGRLRFIAAGQSEVGPNERPPFGCCLLIWEHWKHRQLRLDA
jgi:hypothetical protein